MQETEETKVATITKESKYKTKKKKQGKPVETVPEDLQSLIKSSIALKNCHVLLQEGNFPFRARDVIGQCLSFLKTLHKQVIDEATAHPQAHLAPELRDEKNKTV